MMFTTYQGASMERKNRRDTRDRADSIVSLPWAKSARQHVLTPRHFPEREVVVLWLCDPGLPVPIDVHEVVVVGDLCVALRAALRQGYTLAVEPVAVTVGTCAIIQDGSGFRLCLLEPTRAP